MEGQLKNGIKKINHDLKQKLSLPEKIIMINWSAYPGIYKYT